MKQKLQKNKPKLEHIRENYSASCTVSSGTRLSRVRKQQPRSASGQKGSIPTFCIHFRFFKECKKRNATAVNRTRTSTSLDIESGRVESWGGVRRWFRWELCNVTNLTIGWIQVSSINLRDPEYTYTTEASLIWTTFHYLVLWRS